MYFTNPNQLIDIFAKLEENNLQLIQNVQDLEQTLDTLKANLAQKKKEFDAKIGEMRENKAVLERKKAENEAKIKYFEFKMKEDVSNKGKDEMLPLRKEVKILVSN